MVNEETEQKQLSASERIKQYRRFNILAGKYEQTLVAWYSIEGKEFLTSTTFSKQEDAQSWIDYFWQAVWRLGL